MVYLFLSQYLVPSGGFAICSFSHNWHNIKKSWYTHQNFFPSSTLQSQSHYWCWLIQMLTCFGLSCWVTQWCWKLPLFVSAENRWGTYGRYDCSWAWNSFALMKSFSSVWKHKHQHDISNIKHELDTVMLHVKAQDQIQNALYRNDLFRQLQANLF